MLYFKMKKLLPYILILVATIGLFGPVVRIEAVTCTAPNIPVGCTPASTSSSSYNLLAPLPNPDNPNQPLSTFDPTQNSNLGAYLNLMIKIFIGICAVLAVIMIVMGGMEYMTSELISNKEEGKKRIAGAIFGLLLALGAYALLYTINPDLLNTDLKSLTAVTVEVDLGNDIPQTPTNGVYANGSKVGDPWTGTPASLPNGVTRQSPECTSVGQMGCTSTIGLNTNALQSIADTDTGCNCQITLTEGTAFWQHSTTTSHKPGSSTVDIKGNTTLDNYLSGGQPLQNMHRYPPPSGSYLYETSHWHIGP